MVRKVGKAVEAAVMAELVSEAVNSGQVPITLPVEGSGESGVSRVAGKGQREGGGACRALRMFCLRRLLSIRHLRRRRRS